MDVRMHHVIVAGPQQCKEPSMKSSPQGAIEHFASTRTKFLIEYARFAAQSQKVKFKLIWRELGKEIKGPEFSSTPIHPAEEVKYSRRRVCRNHFRMMANSYAPGVCDGLGETTRRVSIHGRATTATSANPSSI